MDKRKNEIILDISSSSPLEVTTKAGKLTVSAVENMKKESPNALTKTTPNQLASTTQPQKIKIEIPSKSGTLHVHATTIKDNKLDVS